MALVATATGGAHAEPGTPATPSTPSTPSTPGLTAHQIALLERDPSLSASPDGQIFAVDAWQAPTGAAATADSTADDLTTAQASALTSYSLADTFVMHSRPGANRTIYLDFDGGTLLSTNSWLLNGLSTLVFPGWSLDASPSFSDDERTVIQEVWARVAEDYAPFDIDVTTQEPAAGGLWRASSGDTAYGTRVAFSSGTAVQRALCNGGCGGIAWIGTYNMVTPGETRSPAWVFPSSLGNKAKNLAEAAAHEAGHTLGLSHDGTTTNGYYAGNALWGPIMGSPYAAAVTQWSRGDYLGANNHEDDVAVIAAHGGTLRTDEAGDNPDTALPYTDLPHGTGLITTSADRDWYRLDGCSGTVTAQADPSEVGPNLDIRLELRNASGALLTAAAPATTRVNGRLNGLSATVSRSLTGGPYYVSVAGAGSGEGGASGWASGGYDAYGSLGSYTLAVTGCAGGSSVAKPPSAAKPGASSTPARRPSAPAVPKVAKGATGGKLSIGVRWSTPVTGGAAITGYVINAYRLDARGRVVATKHTSVLPGTTQAVQLMLPKGRWAVRIKARNRIGWGPLSPRSAAAKAR
ncbi:hypothetical protein GCM10022237_11110 [Nocardioides ginsengisoli]|uniref:Fibronectin type III domain-containing protein n=1 Tax=Nocardioides ginsengisoli TaxID=363868 RepID=A0ABW3VZX4_9ACTN